MVFVRSAGGSRAYRRERIKNQAGRSLALIANDPAPHMIEIIKGSGYNYPVKLAALQTIEVSSVSNESKSSVGAAALAEGWRASTNDVNLRMNLAQMRKLAIGMIKRYGTDDEAVYPLLERCYTNGIDVEERLEAISTISTLATDESARRLSKFLMEINQKLQSGTLTQTDEQMIRAIIPALGATKRPIGRPALNSVTALNWTPQVKSLAQQALSQIP